MSSIYCTDCPNYDENEPTICCSTAIRPIRTETVGYFIPERTERTEQKADEYFEHENWGNC